MRTVIGIHAAKENLKVFPKQVKEIWLKNGFERDHNLRFFAEWAKKNQTPIKAKNEKELDKLAPSHQGVAVLSSATPDINIEDLAQLDQAVVLALDEISDPHNVGAILRTSWLLGVKAIMVPKLRSAHLTPATMKVASGGAEHVPLYICNSLANDLTYLKDKGFWIYGLASEASQSVKKVSFNEKVVLVVGSEDKGLRSTTRNVCDELVRVDQVDNAASFNASVAAALVIYEVFRQRKNP